MNTIVENNKVMELPILKHFQTSDITLNPQSWRKGEKGVATVFSLIIFGTIAWGLYQFILPIVFTWIGKALGAIAVAVLVIGFFILLPAIIKGFKKLARALTKLFIKYDPFGELEEQKQKMIGNREEFKKAKAKIKAIKSSMEGESLSSEKEAKDFGSELLIPSNQIRLDLRNLTYSKLGPLKEYWKVSKAAIVYKAKKLGFLDDFSYRNLNIELSRRGEKKAETGFVPLDSPTLLNKIIKLYMDQYRSSSEELAALTSLVPDDFNKYFSEIDDQIKLRRLVPSF